MAIQRIGRRSSHGGDVRPAGPRRGVEVEVRLVEAVEEHESVSSGVGDRQAATAEKYGLSFTASGTSLVAHGRDDRRRAPPRSPAAVGIGGDVVEVELDGTAPASSRASRTGSSHLESRVEAGDDRDVGGGLDALEIAEVGRPASATSPTDGK